ncbi:MAG: ATP-binding cassette domain-containing protein [Lachnospiraceae bacterium]|jgi:oligopeptide/dipeptide ABC transporter ATP-binding protein|nr:ATP-binding cassette domain-containing protein [Lachnospiraceae bacterium]
MALLEVKHLKKYFQVSSGILHAVDDVSFTLEEGKTLGVVGESGCGKSTLGKTIIRLTDPTSGKVIFDGKDVAGYSVKEFHKVRPDMQMIFQDPFASLDPRLTVTELIAEPMRIYKKGTKEEIYKRVKGLMDMVQLAERFANSYPHELDGGRRQRIGIARALALHPRFVVCDEPVSALDVSIQAQVLNLLQDLQKELKLTYMFITHDMSVVKHISDDIIVMYLGQIVEKSPAKELFQRQFHPYTNALLSAIPVPSLHGRKEKILIQGELSSPINPKDCCRFAGRCAYCMEQCKNSPAPPLKEVSPNHFAACHRVEEMQDVLNKAGG